MEMGDWDITATFRTRFAFAIIPEDAKQIKI
jgi:hypothetical protein